MSYTECYMARRNIIGLVCVLGYYDAIDNVPKKASQMMQHQAPLLVKERVGFTKEPTVAKLE